MRAEGALALLVVSVFLCMSAQVTAQGPCQEDGLVAYWQFAEGQGETAFDLCEGSNGVIHGGTRVDGKVNGAIGFDGVDDYIDFGNPEPLAIAQEITVLMWVWVERQPTEAYELLYKPGSYVLYLYQKGDTCMVMGAVTAGGKSSHPQRESELSYGRWCQVGFVFGVFDKTGIKKLGNIVDGQVVASAPLDGDMPVTSNSLLLNARHLHRVAIDDLRIYDRALAPQEIEDVYVAALSETEARTRSQTHAVPAVALYRNNRVVVAAISTVPFLLCIAIIVRRVLRTQQDRH